jgi:hypothetical protein
MSNPSKFLNHSVFMIRGCKNPKWLNFLQWCLIYRLHTYIYIYIYIYIYVWVWPTVWKVFHVKILAPRILRRLVSFGEICAQLLVITYRPHTTSQTHHLFTCDIATISGRLSQVPLDCYLITTNLDQTPIRGPAKPTYACISQSLLSRLLATDSFRIVPPVTP